MTYSIYSLTLTYNNIFLVHCYVRFANYVGRAILLGHAFIRYVPNNSFSMYESVFGESRYNKLIRWERNTFDSTIANNIAYN